MLSEAIGIKIPQFSYDYDMNWVEVTYPSGKSYAYTDISPFHWKTFINKYAKQPHNVRVSALIKYLNKRVKAGTSKSKKLDSMGRMVEAILDGDSIRDVVLDAISQVAKTILQQLGGNKFLTMTGAKNLVGDKDKLMFALGRNKASTNKVIITLRTTDLYDMEFGRIRGSSYKTLKVFRGVYADQLQEIFADYTGLATRL